MRIFYDFYADGNDDSPLPKQPASVFTQTGVLWRSVLSVFFSVSGGVGEIAVCVGLAFCGGRRRTHKRHWFVCKWVDGVSWFEQPAIEGGNPLFGLLKR